MSIILILNRLVCVVFFSVLTACGAQQQRSISVPAESAKPITVQKQEAHPDYSSSAPELSAAVGELLSQARLQYRYGQYQYAVGTAERGLRIDRGQSEWYLILAESYLKLGSSGNAQQFARQGLRHSSPVGQSYQRLKQISDGQF